MKNLSFFSIFFIIYFVQVIFHFILCYKILKSENKISGFWDFMYKSNSIYPIMYQIFFKRKMLKSKTITNLFIFNTFFAIISFIFLSISVFFDI
ncbi:hypothetical protein EGK75_13275 [Neisseria weixii]|uniref:YggT family protein n=1 Tax=Neisseria weixii TaxID=1853276 RepID=A0A3N4MHS7_9NEIS|nr:hypothetical protein EGK74_13265 [Neisseria weixii]RPD83368.1 hypothetical protein EGK75_13275 [Neisseria weixii]